MNDEFADYLAKLTDDQVKAQLPTQAAVFFTQHPPLLTAWRARFRSLAASQLMIQEYFYTLTPDVQYGLVFEISEMMQVLASLHTCFVVVKTVKAASMLDDAKRFVDYGVNLHLSSDHYNRLLTLLAESVASFRIQIQATTDKYVIDNCKKEIDLNKSVFDAMGEQFAKAYPVLHKSVAGKG